MRDDISTEHAMIATQRIMRSFGDVIGGRRDIMERIVFRVITGDVVFDNINDDDEEEERISLRAHFESRISSGNFFPRED